MELKKIIASLNPLDLFEKKSVICFRAKEEYPLLFFSLMMRKVKKYHMVEIIDADEQELSQIISRLETSFLGNKIIYWFSNVSHVSKNKKEKLLDYFSNYTGPNNVVFFATYEDVPKIFTNWMEIPLADQVESNTYSFILEEFCGVSKDAAKYFSQVLQKKYKQLPLDTLCLLAEYNAVLGKNINFFFEQWIDQLIAPQSSLFILSKYFFAKNERLFFLYWSKIKSLYTSQFWVVFWLEQLWRASGFITFSRKKQYNDAKQISFRLPFSFLQKDWREYSVRELKKAHEFVYTLDYNLKHGNSDFGLDFFFSKFFTNQFI